MSIPLEHSERRLILAFMAAGLAAVMLIAAIGFVTLRRTATADAVRDARDLTQAQAKIVVLLITDRVLAGDSDALALLDLAVRQRVLSRRIVQVKVWSPDGRVAYSDDPALVGRRLALSPKARQALRTGGVDVELSKRSRPENASGKRYARLIEGYTAISTTAGQPALFEASIRFDATAADGRRTLRAFAPALAAGLLVLWLAQVPLAVGLSRRLRSRRGREGALLARAVEHARERRYRWLVLAPTGNSAPFYRRAGFVPAGESLLVLDPTAVEE
jgi:hypothetical protein